MWACLLLVCCCLCNFQLCCTISLNIHYTSVVGCITLQHAVEWKGSTIYFFKLIQKFKVSFSSVNENTFSLFFLKWCFLGSCGGPGNSCTDLLQLKALLWFTNPVCSTTKFFSIILWCFSTRNSTSKLQLNLCYSLELENHNGPHSCIHSHSYIFFGGKLHKTSTHKITPLF